MSRTDRLLSDCSYHYFYVQDGPFTIWLFIPLLLHAGWTVCQLAVMKRPGQDVGDLYILNVVKGQPVLIQKLPGYSTSIGQEVRHKFMKKGER